MGSDEHTIGMCYIRQMEDNNPDKLKRCESHKPVRQKGRAQVEWIDVDHFKGRREYDILERVTGFVVREYAVESSSEDRIVAYTGLDLRRRAEFIRPIGRKKGGDCGSGKRETYPKRENSRSNRISRRQFQGTTKNRMV
jgi:hypothetical protein